MLSAFRSNARRCFYHLLSRPALYRRLRLWYGGVATILAFHRVVPDEFRSQLEQNRDLEMTPEDLDSLIRWFIERKTDVVSLDALHHRLTNGHTASNCVLFTFDDGYQDNFEYAFPIFKKHDVPMSIYITTDFPDRKVKLWWYLLEKILLERSELAFEMGSRSFPFSLRTLAQKNVAFSQIKNLILSSSVEENELLFMQLGFSDSSFIDIAEKLAMDWGTLQKIANEPLVTIGAHSITHSSLSFTKETQLNFEIQGSGDLLRQKLGKRVAHFAYPFGSKEHCGEREFQAAKAAGYLTAVTSRAGNVMKSHRDHLHCLPRHSPTTGGVLSLEDLELRLSGYPLIRSHHFNRVVTE